MKRISFYLLVIIFTIVLAGCTPDSQTKLDTPIVQTYEDGIVTWTEIENTEKYEVQVNDLPLRTVYGTSFDVSTIMAESLVDCYVKVKAISESYSYKDSDWSPLFDFDYVYADNTDTEDVSPPELLNDRYLVKQVSNDNGLVLDYSFTDFYKDYYVFYTGVIEKAPIYIYDTTLLNDTLTEYTFTAETVTEKKIEESHQNIVSNSTTTVESESIGAEIGSKIKTSMGDPVVAQVSAEITSKISSNSTVEETIFQSRTVNDTFTTATSYSTSKTISFTQTRTQGNGYYRFAIYAMVDIYVVLVHDRETDTYIYEYLSYARPGEVFHAVDFSSDNNFNPTIDTKIVFDESIILTLETPENTIPYGDNTDFLAGIGTQDFPYLISNPTHFNNMFNAEYNTEDTYFQLFSDIDTSYIDNTGGYGIFYGKLNGKGYTIGGIDGNYMEITETSHNNLIDDSFGLIKHNVGEIKNINFSYIRIKLDENLKDGISRVGLIGKNSGTISNVSVSNSYILLHNDSVVLDDTRAKDYKIYQRAGGIAGINEGTIEYASVTNVELECYMRLYAQRAAGTIGGIAGNNNGTIRQSMSAYNTMQITIDSRYYQFVSWRETQVSVEFGGVAGINVLQASIQKTISYQNTMNYELQNHEYDQPAYWISTGGIIGLIGEDGPFEVSENYSEFNDITQEAVGNDKSNTGEDVNNGSFEILKTINPDFANIYQYGFVSSGYWGIDDDNYPIILHDVLVD